MIDAEMKNRIDGVTTCETPPVLPRNSPPLQASARQETEESFILHGRLYLIGHKWQYHCVSQEK